MQALRLLALTALALTAAGAAGAAGPPSFQLVLDGRHNADLLHEGTFTTASAWCPSGTLTDVSIDSGTDTATRRLTCAGGGDLTAIVRPLPAEHGGSGSWQIVAGSGPLANLRGKGTFTSVRVSGSPDSPSTLTFRSTWSGAADFDVDGPKISITSAGARKLKRPNRVYTLRIAMSLVDAGGGSVSYTLQVADSKKPTTTLVYKAAQANGAVTASYRITVPKTTRALQIKLDASDAVGNVSSVAKKIALP